MRCSRAQNVPKTKVERAKLVEIIGERKKVLAAENIELTSCYKTKKHQIRYKIPKLHVTGSIPVARSDNFIDYIGVVDCTSEYLDHHYA
jgi:hypothetical protein